MSDWLEKMAATVDQAADKRAWYAKKLAERNADSVVVSLSGLRTALAWIKVGNVEEGVATLEAIISGDIKPG